LGATAVSNWEITGKNSESLPAIQQKIAEFKRLRSYFYGDYYPLTPVKTGDGDWMAYQLNRPSDNDGIILAFRRAECGSESINVKLKGIDRNAVYELYFEDYGLPMDKPGSELCEGMKLSIPLKPASLLISYRKKQ
jgi:alpha-galactosidase